MTLHCPDAEFGEHLPTKPLTAARRLLRERSSGLRSASAEQTRTRVPLRLKRANCTAVADYRW